MDLVKKGAVTELMAAGATIRYSILRTVLRRRRYSGEQHTEHPPYHEKLPGTVKVPSRATARSPASPLMDARSIAATAANGGYLTSAETIADGYEVPAYEFDSTSYERRVYQGYGKADPEAELIYGPNIKDWPTMSALTDNIILRVCSKIMGPCHHDG